MKLPTLPVSVSEIVQTNKEFMTERSRPVKVLIFVDPTASKSLVDLVRSSFVPQTPAGKLRVEVLAQDVVPIVDPSADLALIIQGSTPNTSALINNIQQYEGIYPVVLATADTDKDALHKALEGVDPKFLVVGAHAQEALDLLVKHLATTHEDRLALAANFSLFRKAVASDLLNSTAMQNGVIGAVIFIPGADMPVMTLNQVKMVLQMAAAYNRPMDKERFAEIAAVIASAFGWRKLARSIVGTIPGFGWAIKGATGYTGTLAIGRAAIEYFERDWDIYESVQGVIEQVKPNKREIPALEASAAENDS